MDAGRTLSGDLARHHGAEGMAHQQDFRQPQALEHLVVAEDQVPEAVDVLDGIRFPRGRPRVLRREYREVAGQRVEERPPRETPWPMEEDHGPALALDVDSQRNSILPDGDGLLLRRRHRAAP